MKEPKFEARSVDDVIEGLGVQGRFLFSRKDERMNGGVKCQ